MGSSRNQRPANPLTSPSPTPSPATASTQTAHATGTCSRGDAAGQLQNSQTVVIHFLGFSGHLSFAVAMLIAAVCGLLLVATPGTVRIMQLGRALKKTASPGTNAAPQPGQPHN
jgi:Lipopolysaccharide assembly protein A domain